jgi:hypothetical protein
MTWKNYAAIGVLVAGVGIATLWHHLASWRLASLVTLAGGGIIVFALKLRSRRDAVDHQRAAGRHPSPAPQSALVKIRCRCAMETAAEDAGEVFDMLVGWRAGRGHQGSIRTCQAKG